MSVNLIIGIICLALVLLLGIALLIRFLQGLIQWSYKEGWQGGVAHAEQNFIDAGKQVDEARQQIWRDEARR